MTSPANLPTDAIEERLKSGYDFEIVEHFEDDEDRRELVARQKVAFQQLRALKDAAHLARALFDPAVAHRLASTHSAALEASLDESGRSFQRLQDAELVARFEVASRFGYPANGLRVEYETDWESEAHDKTWTLLRYGASMETISRCPIVDGLPVLDDAARRALGKEA